MNARQSLLFVRRFLMARKFGVTFPGTSHFRMPDTFWLCGRKVQLSLPAESGFSLDFINLALDDEYGLRRVPFQPNTVIDVGANVGLFSLLAADKFPNATIHAYEPNPRIFPNTAHNLGLVGASAFPFALGARRGFAEIYDQGESRLATTIAAQEGPIEVDSLSSAIERIGGEVDLLKLDCEGAEWNIFEDVEAFKRVRIIRMEYHLSKGQSLDNLNGVATKLGLKIDHLQPRNNSFGIAWLSMSSRRKLSSTAQAAFSRADRMAEDAPSSQADPL